jgi:hypothetical protein
VLPQVTKDLHLISKNLKVVKITVSDEDFAEVTLPGDSNNQRKHIVDLKNNKCSSRE